MAFTFEGKNPSLSVYQELGSLGDLERVEWKIFHRLGQERITLLLVAQGRAKSKANYRDLVWNGLNIETGRDADLLETHRNELYLRLLSFLRENVPLDCELLTAMPGRLREGNAPEEADWEKISVVLYDGAPWAIYRRHVNYEADWVGVKAVAEAPVPRKANYYLKWNGERLAKGKEAALLAEHRPELCDAIVNSLSELGVSGRKEAAKPKIETPWINLGPVGVVANLERDLLVLTIPIGRLEVRLSTSQPSVPTDIYSCTGEEDGGGLTFDGVLYHALKRNTPEVWARVEELLRQYFLEKSFN